MNMKKSLLLYSRLLFFVLAIWTHCSFGQFPKNKVAVFEHYNNNNGLPSNSTNCFVQDKNDYIWVSHDNGLSYFDGFDFEVFSHIDKRITNSLEVNSMVCGADNTLYLSTSLDGICKITPDRKNVTFFLNNKHESPNVLLVLEDNLFIGTNNGVRISKTNTELPENYKLDSTVGKEITSFCKFNNNFLLAGTKGGEIVMMRKLANGKFIVDDIVVYDPEKQIIGIVKIGESSSLIATDNEVKIFDISTKRFHKILLNSEFIDDTTLIINGIVKSKFTSLIYISTHNNGLKSIDLLTGTYSNWVYSPYSKQGLNDNNIISIYEDNQANLWVSTKWGGGINIYSPQSEQFDRFVFHEGNDFINRNFINDFEEYNNFSFYIAGIGGIAKFNSLTNELVNIHSSFPGSEYPLNIRALEYQKEKNVLWAGVDGQGLLAYNIKTKKIKYYSKKNTGNTVSNDAVYDLHLDKTGKLWIGTWGGGLNMYDTKTGKFTKFTIDAFNLNNNTVIDIDEDENGDLWLATFGRGLLRFEVSTQKIYAIKFFEGIENFMNLFSVFVDTDGLIWAGSFANGLMVYNPETGHTKKYNEANGFHFELISSIIQDNRKDIWIAGTQELCKISHKDSSLTFYGQNYGIQNATFSLGSASKDRQGNLYFGTSRGMLRFNPSEIRTDTLLPKTRITKIYIDDIVVYSNAESNADEIKKPVEISNSTKTISFEFSAMFFFKSQSTRYSYKLNGFDNEWKRTSAQERKATYTNLPPGTYTFNVISSNSTGVWNYEPASFTFIITPPFYYNPFFISLIIIIIISLIYFVIIWRLRALQKSRQRLKNVINQRVAQINNQNKDLATKRFDLYLKKENLKKINKDVINQIRKINLQNNDLAEQKKKIETQTKEIEDSIEYAKNIQKALMHSANDLKATFKDSFLVLKPKYKVSGDFFWIKEQEKSTVVICADCTGYAVHGAFMSVLCYTLFNELFRENIHENPEEVIQFINERLYYALNINKKENSTYDGIEMSVSILPKTKNEIIHASTGISMFLKRSGDNSIEDYLAQKIIVGKSKTLAQIQSIVIPVQKNDDIIFTTDGLITQRGGKNFEKFGYEKFKEIISNHAENEKSYIESLEKWIESSGLGDNEQSDDVLIIGFKINN